MSKQPGRLAPYSKLIAAGIAAVPTLAAQGLIPNTPLAHAIVGAVGLVASLVAVWKAPANVTAHEQAVRAALDELAALRQAAAEAEAAKTGVPTPTPVRGAPGGNA